MTNHPILSIALSVLMASGVAAFAQTTRTELQANANIQANGVESMPLYLAVTVNGRDAALIAQFNAGLEGENMSSPRSELKQVGIAVPAGLGDEVSLSALPGVSYRYDASEQRVYMSASNRALLPDVISAARAPDYEAPEKSWGAVLNYALTLDHISVANGAGSSTVAGAFDGWIFSPFGTLRSTGSYSRPILTQTGTTPGGRFVREETTWQYHAPSRAVTMSVGDFTTRGPNWMRPIRMGGVQLRRDFSLRSDLVTDQRLSFAGAAAVPSSVDVFIENNRVYSGSLNSGPFRLEDIPVNTGSGDAEIVVTGDDGRTKRKKVSFFSSANLIKKGMADWSLSAGHARQAYGLDNAAYDASTILSASLRYGLSHAITVEGYATTTQDFQMIGAGFTAVPLALGEVSLAGARSRYNGHSGNFWQIGVSTQIGPVDIDARSSRSDAGYADLAYVTGVAYLGASALVSSASLLETARAQDVISVSIPVTAQANRVGLSYVRSKRSNSHDRLVSASYAMPLAGGRGALSVSGSHDFTDDDTRISMGLSLKLGKRSYVRTAAYTSSSGRQTRDVTWSRPVRDEIGDFGYLAQAGQQSGQTALRAKAQYRGRLGLISGEVQKTESQTYLRGELDGSLVMAGGHLAAGNLVNDSFAVVDTGVPNMPIMLQNRAVAKTGRNGRALIAGLNSYHRNRISVDVADFPDGSSPGLSASDVIPARLSGRYVDFRGSQGAGVIAVLRDGSGAVLPAGTLVRVAGGVDTYVGYDGQTWLENASATNSLRAELDRGTCKAKFAFHASGDVQDVIDPVVCQ
ncbi:fimbria/pilus outer membrane usher protein [Thioclava sp.]|uniref:fimbria/pilus outer membrane usher protein n=1 Tax=Thioclava sp. TaxID=1933450 RepID=UPI003AA9B3DE